MKPGKASKFVPSELMIGSLQFRAKFGGNFT